MKPHSFYLLVLLLFSTKAIAQTEAEPSEHVTVFADDSVEVHLYLFTATKEIRQTAPIILLFHHALSNTLAENREIIPRLISLGYNLALTDLRVGMTGEHGGTNMTAAGWKNKTYDSYCLALADMEASYQFIKTRFPKNKKILWGSGYSASIALQLSIQHANDFEAGLLFAPAQGGPVKPCEPTAAILKQIAIQFIAFRAESEMDDNRYQQANLFRAHSISYHVIPSNQHGSSILDAERNPESQKKTWAIVHEFLQKIDLAASKLK
jgi:alpha-beta hydrolase superfamily lysophospholipase